MKDEELVKRINAGEMELFEEIIARYETKVFGVIYYMMRNKNEVEDIAQEVFIKVFKNLRKFKGDSSLYTWIYKITVNLCLDELKKRKKVVYLDEKVEVNDSELEIQLSSNEKDQAKLYEEKELKECMQKCIRELPEKQRIMLILRDIQGLPYEEISRITGIKLGTVKSQINRARLKLKDLIEKEGTFLEYIESN